MYLALRTGLLSVCDFVTSCIGNLGNIGSVNYINLSDVDMFRYRVFLKTYFILLLHLIKKFFKYWEAVKFMMVDTDFPKF